jgi:MSHA biogenesis protein MshJ
VTAFGDLLQKATALAERLDALSLRERCLIFAACVTLLYVAWQTLLMAPLANRTRIAEQHLADAHQHLVVIDRAGEAGFNDPAVAAAARNRALKGRLAELDANLATAASGYVSPDKVTELLRGLLAVQHGLTLVSLTNLPVVSLSKTAPQAMPAATPAAAALAAASPAAAAGGPSATGGVAARDPGPFVHPVEIVLEGDYASLVEYLRSLEGMPWRIHWQELELTAGSYPTNRVRIVIGALSMSPDWIAV